MTRERVRKIIWNIWKDIGLANFDILDENSLNDVIWRLEILDEFLSGRAVTDDCEDYDSVYF